MYLRVTHETRYDYMPAVKTAQHMAHLKPRNDAQQQLVQHRLVVSPSPAEQSEVCDVYGNVRTFFSLQSAHDELTVAAHSIVRTMPAPRWFDDPSIDTAWEAVRERFRYRAGAASSPASEFCFASPYVPRHDDFVQYARPSFAPGVPLLRAAHDLMQRMHADFTYETDSTEINTPAVEALAQRCGVCQDFAHIMIACLRGMGLPARYVSGYLLTHAAPGRPKLVGSDASHAWISVYLPGEAKAGQWFDLDPTNNRSPAEDYVTLAVGRDFADVSPLRGVLHGGADHTLDVAVTVEQLPEPVRTTS